jgi:hypothetical protein
MIIRLIKVYAVHQGDDDRNSGTPAWFFYSKAQADAMAKGKGWYGGTAPVRAYDALSIYNDEQVGRLSGSHNDEPATVYLLQHPHPLKMDQGPVDEKLMREAALAKLTPTEKELLGLK